MRSPGGCDSLSGGKAVRRLTAGLLSNTRLGRKLGHNGLKAIRASYYTRILHPILLTHIAIMASQWVSPAHHCAEGDGGGFIFSPGPSCTTTSQLDVWYMIWYDVKNYNRRNSRGHHGSKRRELAQQHAHSRGSLAFTHTLYIVAQWFFFNLSFY